MISKILALILSNENETRQLLKFVRQIAPQAGSTRILDVGCGYGRNLDLLQRAGYDVVGVEANEQIVQANTAKGLKCVSVEEWDKLQDTYDIIVMSHVVEHFSPSELLIFMDGYLDRLKTGGHLIICTPLLTKNFFDDFDHVRPYQPIGIEMVFGNNSAQVQYYSRNKLALKDIWFRRSYFRIHLCRGVYIKSLASKLILLFDCLSALLFKSSCGLVGHTSGWVGIYKKLN
jgi:SAM-dependent methyltransferase